MSKSKTKSKNILVLLTGSIACYKTCEVVSLLVKDGYAVKTVATDAALKFIGAATLEGLTGHAVQSDLFAQGQAMEHIHLNKWADLALVCPASANTLNATAAGLATNLVSNILLAWDYEIPLIMAPAMNSKMYQHPVTQKSISLLKSWGIDVLDTDFGNLACGDFGAGRLLKPDTILRCINHKLNATTTPQMKPAKNILVTAGGTVEAIDGVRSLSNFSTGVTGGKIALQLENMGHNVTLLKSKASVLPENFSGLVVDFTSYENLKQELFALLKKSYDLVVHTAAVSDYTIDKLEVSGEWLSNNVNTKLASSNEIQIKLRKTQKLINLIKSESINKNIKLIGFKLTKNAIEQERQEAIHRLFQAANPEFIIHNDLSEIESGQHTFYAHSINQLESTFNNTDDLSNWINNTSFNPPLKGDVNGPLS